MDETINLKLPYFSCFSSFRRTIHGYSTAIDLDDPVPAVYNLRTIPPGVEQPFVCWIIL